MIELDDKQLEVLAKSGAKIVVKNAPETKPSEVTEILREMRRFNSAVVGILSQPAVATQTAMQPMLAPPIVRVEPPIVNVTPSIRIEQPARRWKFTVTRRDIQQRIQEIQVESLE